MPRYPDSSPTIAAVGGSVYSNLRHKLPGAGSEIFPLHVGDTWMEPPRGTRMEDLTVAEHPGMHRYAPVQGLPPLLTAIAERVERRMKVPTRPDHLLVAAGATGGLGAAAGAIVAPGDEVLLLAPYWPLIAGIVRSFHGLPVAVPMPNQGEAAETVIAALEELSTARTIALYLNTTNNPSGVVLHPSWVEAIAEWARKRNLWILADEVYEDYIFEGSQSYIRSIAPERTFSAHSFSKAFGMAGNRCGYVVGPAEKMRDLRKVSTHTFYSTPTASQIAAIAALETGSGDAWAQKACEQYAETGKAAARLLGVDPPQGSTFLFVHVANQLDERGLEGLLIDCAREGLLLAPGTSFGPYPTHVRLCYTSIPPDRALQGVEILARILNR